MLEIERAGGGGGGGRKTNNNIGTGIRIPSFSLLLQRRRQKWLSWFPEQATLIALPIITVLLYAWPNLLLSHIRAQIKSLWSLATAPSRIKYALLHQAHPITGCACTFLYNKLWNSLSCTRQFLKKMFQVFSLCYLTARITEAQRIQSLNPNQS